MKKKFVVLFAVVGLLVAGIAGCNELTLEQVQGLAGQVEQLNGILDQYQTQNLALLQQLADQGQVKPDVIEAAVKVSAEADKVQEQITAIAAAIKQVQPSGDQVQDLIAGAKAANAASTPWNPYAPIIDVGLALAAALAAIFWRKSAAAATEAQAKYQAHKQGAEAARAALASTGNVAGPAAAELIYDKIGQARARILS